MAKARLGSCIIENVKIREGHGFNLFQMQKYGTAVVLYPGKC